MKALTRAEFVSRDLVALGRIEPQAWQAIATVFAAAIEQDRDAEPRGEEETLP